MTVTKLNFVTVIFLEKVRMNMSKEVPHFKTFLQRKGTKTLRFWYTLLLAILVGTIVFGILYGYQVLNPFYDGWILQGYDELDIPQHYAGWCAFQTSAWHFPLGMADSLGYGTCITYTDSIPWFAILMKLLLQLVGYTGTFQYFGIYTLLCYILQAFAAGLLVQCRTNNLYFQILSMVLLCFSPIFMERAFRHTALGSQWMILFSIYLFLRCKDNHFQSYPVPFYILGILAIGIHPYFIPLTMIFALITTVYGILKTKKAKYFLGMFAGNLITCAFAGWIIGAFSLSVNLSREGFGYYSMNLNAIINPSSIGNYTWSAFLPQRDQINGNYDGFNYFGVGILFLIVVCIFILIVKKSLLQVIRNNWVYIVAMVWMTVYAVSNVVTLDGKELFTIPLPESIVSMCEIFRASSRMFYAVYYSVIIYGILLICRSYEEFKQKAKNKNFQWKSVGFYTLLTAVVALQLYDLHFVIYEKHIGMQNKMEAESLQDDTFLMNLFQKYDTIVTHDRSRVVSVCALKNHMKLLYTIANTTNDLNEKAYQEADKRWADLEKGIVSQDTIFHAASEEEALSLIEKNDNLRMYQNGTFYFLYPAESEK